MFFKFENKDIFYNTIKAYPKSEFFIYSGSAYYNNKFALSGSHNNPIMRTSNGYINLYEENVDRSSYIYPFIIKQSSLDSFKSVTSVNFNSVFQYGDVITGSYPLTSSIKKEYFQTGQSRLHVAALQNTLNYYKVLSPQYEYSSSFGDKATQELGLISIPSIFYGSSIKKGSVKLRYYFTGTLIGELQDIRRNGELIEVSGTNVSGTAGIVLYNEGCIVLTGSWQLSSNTDDLIYDPTNLKTAKWVYFANSMSGNVIAPSSSFQLEFEGTQYIPTITMMCHAKKTQLNHSNNPTFKEFGQNVTAFTGSTLFKEPTQIRVKNILSSSYYNFTSSFKRQTYLSSIAIYDEDKNIIGIAKLANPITKMESNDYTIKIKLDIG